MKFCLLKRGWYFDSLWLFWWCVVPVNNGCSVTGTHLGYQPWGIWKMSAFQNPFVPFPRSLQKGMYRVVNVQLRWKNKCYLCVQLYLLEVHSLPWSHVWILLMAVLEFSFQALAKCLVDGQGLLLPGGMSKGDLFRDADWSGILTSLNHFFFFPSLGTYLLYIQPKKQRSISNPT